MDLNDLTISAVIDAAVANREAYLHNFWATLGFLVVAIGWTFTSKTAQDYLKDKFVRNMSVGIIVLLFIVHASVLIYSFSHSIDLLEIIETIKYSLNEKDKEVLISSYGIPCLWPPVNLSINGILFGFLAWLLFLPSRKN